MLLVLKQAQRDTACLSSKAYRLEVCAHMLGKNINKTRTSGHVNGQIFTLNIMGTQELAYLLGNIKVSLPQLFLGFSRFKQVGMSHRAGPKTFNRLSYFRKLKAGLVASVSIGRVKTCNSDKLSISQTGMASAPLP